MKNHHLYISALFGLLIISLFNTYLEIGDIKFIPGYTYPLSYVSIIVMGIILGLSLSKQLKSVVFISALLSFSSLFFSFFMFVTVSMFNAGNVDYKVSPGIGLLLNIALSVIVTIVSVIHTVKTLSKK